MRAIWSLQYLILFLGMEGKEQMYLKICYEKKTKNKNKKVKVERNMTYQELRQIITKSFHLTNQNFEVYYFDEASQPQDIRDQQSLVHCFNIVKKDKLYIKDKDDDYASPLNQSLLNESSISISQHNMITQNSKKNSSMKESSFSDKDNNSILNGLKDLIHDVNCKGCKKKEIVGIRWKSLKRLDYDLCSECYEKLSDKNKKEDYLQIDTQDYFTKVNYRQTIYKLFNPQYQEEPLAQNEIRKWISQQDLLTCSPETMNQIWKAADPLINKIQTHLDQWLVQFEMISKR